MEYRKLNGFYVVRMDPKEEILETLTAICEKENILCAKVEAIGALSEFTVGVYKVNEKKYYSNHYEMPTEITALIGTITEMNGKPYIHLHLTAADEEGKAYGGHLNKGVISATCEMVITLMDGHIGRKPNEEIGLNFFEFDGNN